MARRSSLRQQAALKSVDYIGSQYAVRNEMTDKSIRQKSFEKREKSIDDMFAFATEALGVMDKYQQKKAEDVKIGKSVTSMAGKEGGEVSYKKPKIADWIKGDAKFSEIGKESWNVGGQDYSRADMLAYDKFEQKNKWEDKIGEDMELSDAPTAVEGEVVMKPVPGIDKAKPKDKDYTLKGSTKAIEDEYGAGWSYDKQKAISKSERKVARQISAGKKRLDRQLAPARKAKAQAYEQVVGLSKEPGKGFDKIMGAYEQEYGATSQTKELKQTRLDFIKENPGMNKEVTDVEPQPSKIEDLIGKVKGWHQRQQVRQVREQKEVDVFNNLTEETDAKSDVGTAINADTSVPEMSDPRYADRGDPFDVGEDGMTEVERARSYKPPSPFDDAPVKRLKLPPADTRSPEQWQKDMAAETEKASYDKGVNRALDYLQKEGGAWAFDESISTAGLSIAPTSVDKKAGTATFGLYGGEGGMITNERSGKDEWSNQLYKDVMTVKLDDKGMPTRNLVNVADPFKKWSGLGELSSDIGGGGDRDVVKGWQEQLLALSGSVGS